VCVHLVSSGDLNEDFHLQTAVIAVNRDDVAGLQDALFRGRRGLGLGLGLGSELVFGCVSSVDMKSRVCGQVFHGNSNTYIAEVREISPAIIARRVRIVPHSTYPRTVCMRVELYGCQWRGSVQRRPSN